MRGYFTVAPLYTLVCLLSDTFNSVICDSLHCYLMWHMQSIQASEEHLVKQGSLMNNGCSPFLLCQGTKESTSLNEHHVVHIGDNVTLSCAFHKCLKPEYFWKAAMDKTFPNPHGTANNTFSVKLDDENDIICEERCDSDRNEKLFKIFPYSFPSDPVITLKNATLSNRTTTIICEVASVYPCERMTITLTKDGKDLDLTSCSDSVDNKPVTMSSKYDIVLTSEDDKKNITCVASFNLQDKNRGRIEKISTLTLELYELSKTSTESPSKTENGNGAGFPTNSTASSLTPGKEDGADFPTNSTAYFSTSGNGEGMKRLYLGLSSLCAVPVTALAVIAVKRFRRLKDKTLPECKLAA
ncbi:vascular cell adhesion protein 1-like isoform X2 [Protopterus annectens]|uniref:vascular cell adhesion protein 1-like isoform X2 n=1 Tax=Protopterus annectens TaxID=7888 RepID=UPI001CF99398|nr:vascular cell adhesion protein 1-like isoform X2 [Protopterus annectens]